MAKNTLVIDDERRRWAILHNFEERQKAQFLKGLGVTKSLKIFSVLYQFAQETTKRKLSSSIDLEKIGNLSRVHLMLSKVKK